MKKYIIYIVLMILGILIGKFAFSGTESNAKNHTHETTAENEVWTCSMHPQIQQPEPGDCPICGMDLIPAQQETQTDALATNQFRMTKNALALANIETTVVGSSDTENEELTLSGTIEPNEKTNAIQTAHFAGRIEKLYINFTGEEVRKGQLIALIYAPELVTTQQELLTAARMKASQPKLYNAVRNKLKLWKLSEQQIQKIENSNKAITKFPIYANVSGVVTSKMVEEGNHVMEGQALFKISNLNTVWATFDAYEKQLNSIKKGAAINITTNADPTVSIKGNVTFIDPILNTATRTVAVKVELPNAKQTLKPGMFVEGKLQNSTPTKTSGLSIPKSAVLWTGKRSVVYVKTNPNEPIFELREITLGTASGTSYEVISGLNAQEEIVTNGAFTVDAAAQLQGKKSMMTSNEKTEDTTAEEAMKIVLASEIQQAFLPAIQAYIEIKDALVKSDSNLAAEKSNAFRKILEKIPVSQRKESHLYWSKLHKSSKSIQPNVSLEIQRKGFEMLSKYMIELVENFDTLETSYTVQFCPMAANDKGAYWLSKETQIRNPYFGDAMLTCGSVKKTLN